MTKKSNILRRLFLPTGKEVLETSGGGILGLADVLARLSGMTFRPGGKLFRRLGTQIGKELPDITYAASIPIAGALVTNRMGKGSNRLVRQIGEALNPYSAEAESVFGKGLGLREVPGYKKTASFFLGKENFDMGNYRDRLNKYAQEAKIKQADMFGTIAGAITGFAAKELGKRFIFLRARQTVKKVIEDIKKEDQVVRDANPALLDEAAEIVAKYAPSICNNKNIVKPFLHSFIMSNGNIDVSAVAQLTRLEKDFSGIYG